MPSIIWEKCTAISIDDRWTPVVSIAQADETGFKITITDAASGDIDVLPFGEAASKLLAESFKDEPVPLPKFIQMFEGDRVTLSSKKIFNANSEPN